MNSALGRIICFINIYIGAIFFILNVIHFFYTFFYVFNNVVLM